jgi:hypothetical protein
MQMKSRDLSLLLVLPLTLLAGACSHAPKPQTTAQQEVRLEGEITQGIYGCVQVKTADGQRYSLARDLDGWKAGQHVWVEGYLVKTKGCMPGLSLMPQRAGLINGGIGGNGEVAAQTVVAGSSGSIR